mgnify:CR=1 FL=1
MRQVKTYKLFKVLPLTLLFLGFGAHGALALPPEEALPPTFEDRLPTDMKENPTGFFTFTLENDLFGSGNDRNYTNGTRLTYHKVGEEPPALAKWLGDVLPTFKVNKSTTVYYALGQNLYTPEDITTPAPDPTDRPYAAFLYGSAGFSSVNGNHIDDLEFTLGVVGPLAFGEEVQSTVHEIVAADDPRGWDAQLDNEPGLMLSWQRRWPEAVGTDIGPFYFRVNPHLGATVGNIYTYGAGGITLQLTPAYNKWQSQPLRVRPAIPGSGYFQPPEEVLGWSLFIGTEGRALARNIFLDGNTFEDSPSVNKKHFVADISGGLSLTYGRMRASYTLNWRSREFHGQDDGSLFGAISVGWRF